MCSIEVESHQCSDVKEMTCCEMMDMNSSNSIPRGMEITDNSCDYTIDGVSDHMFLVPKTVDTNFELIKVDNTILSIDQQTPVSFVQSQILVSYSTPPIYITISSFLI